MKLSQRPVYKPCVYRQASVIINSKHCLLIIPKQVASRGTKAQLKQNNQKSKIFLNNIYFQKSDHIWIDKKMLNLNDKIKTSFSELQRILILICISLKTVFFQIGFCDPTPLNTLFTQKLYRNN